MGTATSITAQEILKQLEPLGSEGYRKILRNHGAPEPLFGVKISDLKKFQKKIKKDYRLALDLFETGNYDARYLAGLIADDAKMTQKDLQRWVETANCAGIGEWTVAWVAAGSNHGWELALKWIESKKEGIAAAGWSALGGLVAIKPDVDLDIPALKRLLERIGKSIHDQPNRVRYTMNMFVIGVAAYVKPLTEFAIETAKKIGEVTVDMGGTACKIPRATDYIKKIQARGSIGKKRKTVKC